MTSLMRQHIPFSLSRIIRVDVVIILLLQSKTRDTII